MKAVAEMLRLETRRHHSCHRISETMSPKSRASQVVLQAGHMAKLVIARPGSSIFSYYLSAEHQDFDHQVQISLTHQLTHHIGM